MYLFEIESILKLQLKLIDYHDHRYTCHTRYKLAVDWCESKLLFASSINIHILPQVYIYSTTNNVNESAGGLYIVDTRYLQLQTNK